MKLIEIDVENYRSIKKLGKSRVAPFQIIIGENNCGKSNTLNSVEVFLSAGSGGINASDFNDKSESIVIKCTFLLESEKYKKIWKAYAINNNLYLEKHVWLEADEKTGKITIKNEYHGYKAEPKDWFLSIKKIKDTYTRPKWQEIVKDNNLPEYFLNNGSCTQADYVKGIAQYIQENEVEYDDLDLSGTQALGLQSNVIANLPKFYLLKAQANYSDETDKRTTTSTFRKLMADLTDRIIKNDPRYSKIEEALKVVDDLLNSDNNLNQSETRLESLTIIEDRIHKILTNLMPSVEKIKLRVATEDVRSIFSRGVELSIDDGVETEVLLKGHGLQRCVVFSLLQALILNERNIFLDNESAEENYHPIILAIEEPELYIHPQLGKLFYDVLLTFSEKDQVIYTTHSPRFLDVYRYDSITMAKKTKTSGTVLETCNLKAFDGLKDRDIFQKFTQLNSDINELFFAKKVILLEGPEDKIAVSETMKKLALIKNRTEEKDITMITTGGKNSMPFFIRVLNAFNIKYAVLHDYDIREGMHVNEKGTEEIKNNNISQVAGENIVTFPIKLEETVGVNKDHFKDQYEAILFFSDHSNINIELEKIVRDLLEKLE